MTDTDALLAALLAADGPAVVEPIDALRLLAAVECERPDDDDGPEHAEAARARRRAYVWTRAAERWPELADAAAAVRRAWGEAESAAVLAVVEQSAGRRAR